MPALPGQAREDEENATGEARLVQMIKDITWPSRDRAGQRREVVDFRARLAEERRNPGSPRRPALDEFARFMWFASIGLFSPVGNFGLPFDMTDEFEELMSAELEALCALRRNMWVFQAYISTGGHEGPPAWYARRARELAAELGDES